MSRYLSLIEDPPVPREPHADAAQVSGEKPATLINYGKGYRHPDGRVETGQPEPMPRPAVGWPADLAGLLARVSTAFEWSPEDRRDFVAWARRSAEGIEDARAFLKAEAAKLPTPGLSDRRRVALDMLARDPTVRYAWACEGRDRDTDAVILTLAVRGQGCCELAIPRAKFDALALPRLIDSLTREDTP